MTGINVQFSKYLRYSFVVLDLFLCFLSNRFLVTIIKLPTKLTSYDDYEDELCVRLAANRILRSTYSRALRSDAMDLTFLPTTRSWRNTPFKAGEYMEME